MSECNRSKQSTGFSGAEDSVGRPKLSAGLYNSILWALTRTKEAGVRGGVTHTGFAYTLTIALMEVVTMARGRAKKESVNGAGGMPSFVDVKLTAEQKAAFSAEVCDAADLVGFLVSLCDDGYRVGCTWSSEQQAYTVSLTCRDEESVNYGLCMTSFARDLLTAVALARFKHTQVTQGEWKSAGSSRSDDFG